MISKYLIPIGFGITGGLLYQKVKNYYYDLYYYNDSVNTKYVSNIFNYGMLFGAGTSYLLHLKYCNKK